MEESLFAFIPLFLSFLRVILVAVSIKGDTDKGNMEKLVTQLSLCYVSPVFVLKYYCWWFAIVELNPVITLHRKTLISRYFVISYLFCL